jgi:hypothetical protein
MDIATIVGLIGAAILIALPMISGGDPMACRCAVRPNRYRGINNGRPASLFSG